MKKYSILFIFISFLLFTELSAKETNEPINWDSLAQTIKRSAERSKEFALSKDTGNFLLFVLSAGFLLYLPRHLSEAASYNIVDDIIRFPKKHLFDHAFGSKGWPRYFYYELLTLLAGYISLKTGKPVTEKFKNM